MHGKVGMQRCCLSRTKVIVALNPSLAIFTCVVLVRESGPSELQHPHLENGTVRPSLQGYELMNISIDSSME